MTCRNFQLLQVLESVLRLKAETDSRAAEVRKILLVKKKRESLHRGMKQDPETSGPMGQVRNWVLIGFFFFFFCPRVEVSLRSKQKFPGKEKSLFGQLSPFGTSCSLPFRFTIGFPLI
jgi:hypothetical protein